MGDLGVVVAVGQALFRGGSGRMGFVKSLTLTHWSAPSAIPVSCALKQELMQSPRTSKGR